MGKGGKRRGAVTQVVTRLHSRVATCELRPYEWPAIGVFKCILSRDIISINELQIHIQVGLTSSPYISQHFNIFLSVQRSRNNIL